MPDDYILACDLGTGGLKLALYSSAGVLIDSVVEHYATVSHNETWVEQSPDSWWRAFCNMSRALVEKQQLRPTSVATVSFSGHMMACLPVDRNGHALTDCIIWADRRSTVQVDQLHERIAEDEYYRITGNKIYPTYSLPKLMWLKQNQPAVYRKTVKFLQPKDYLVCQLTGVLATDYSDASGTAALDIANRCWSTDLLALADLDADKFPDLHSSVEVVGNITDAAARQCGLSAGTPVVIGAGDGPCGNLGAGVYRHGRAYLYLGTSSWVSVASPQMITDPARVLFNICGVDPSMVYVYGTMQMGGGSFEWLKDTIGIPEKQFAELTGDDPFVYLNRQAEVSSPGSRGLVFLPYLRGERSPRWNIDAKGAFIGLTASHTRGDMIRSVLEGVSYNLKVVRDAIDSQGTVVKEMRAIGGGAESPLWRQIFADVFQDTLQVLTLLEGANTLGAAVLGGTGVGLFDSFEVVDELNAVTLTQEPSADAETRKVYEERYARFNELYEALCPIFGRM